MDEAGHSVLLKFLGRSPKMSDGISSQVPGEQKLRGATESETDEQKEMTSFHYDPVLTVTTEETSFNNGGMRVQKITVSEDISVKYQHLFKTQVKPGKTIVSQVQTMEYNYT
ncbi:unnamed protein product, partial [Leptidea sinapis]